MKKSTSLLRLSVALLFGILTAQSSYAQLTQPPFTPATERMAAYKQRLKLEAASLAADIPARNIGPTVCSGRVADIAVFEDDPSHFFVAYASGGLWKTTDNGISFEPVFDRQMVMTIGDIAVDWRRNVIWVGTGEVNSSRSSYAGTGIYRSTDGGKTWQHRGLPESHHIGRILLHPSDTNTLWVAVLGHLYSPNQERGVYKTTDGGKTWRRTLFVNQNAGAVDLLLDPQNPDILYAATWERSRRAWNFVESGEGSGIWKSTDGGETWSLLTTRDSGFPTGEGVGRIGLAMGQSPEGQVLYALLDNYFRRPKEEKEEEGLTKEELRSMEVKSFLALEDKALEKYLRDNGFPKKYTAQKVKAMVKAGEIKPVALVEYTEDANSLLFDTPVIGAEVYRSTDGGRTWERTHEGYLDRLYNSYGYYFGQIRVAPQNADMLYIMGVPILRSEDGGKTWKSINGENVHVDHHALWVNPRRPGHLILGNDGGVNISYDNGEHWIKCNTPSVAQFYAVAIDMAEPFHVYGGLQDNGVWKGPSTYEHSVRWHSTGRYPYQMVLGGDGMQVEVDWRDNATIYTGFQFGNYFRIDPSGKRNRITPQHELGERPYRFNWQAPIHLSRHNQDILYMGSQYLHRSLNKGQDFKIISPDLTKGGKKGDVPYGTLTTIDESPLQFGLLYTGSDDGRVHRSPDGGVTWKDISVGLPEDLWVSRVEASHHELDRVYVALNGYRWDDFRALIYLSEDRGDTWQRIGTDLPHEPVNVIREDPTNPNLLYVGTDHGLYVSLDRGRSFMKMSKDLPDAPVHDLVVHPRDTKLVVGTHGRSLFLCDVQHLQQLVDSIRRKPLHAFTPAETRASSRWGNPPADWAETPEPEIQLPLYQNEPGTVRFSLWADDVQLNSWEAELGRGLQYPTYDATVDLEQLEAYQNWLNERRKKDQDEIKLKAAKNGKLYLRPGTYRLKLEAHGATAETKLVLK